MPDVFSYIDSRKFLRDSYEERKRLNPSFSYRFIAAHAGINASTFVRIVQGKRNITQNILEKIADVFHLNARETEFFDLIVQFNQTKNHGGQKLYFEKILSFKRASIASILADQYEVFGKWYYIVIRELLSHFTFSDNYEMLARMVTPAIKPKEAKKAIDLLAKLKLIRKDKEQHWRPTERFISVGDNWQSVALANFQIEAMKRAQEAIDLFPSSQRDISTVTISINSEKLQHIREKIQILRREILELENQETHPNRVYQVNFQVFPISETTEGVMP